MLLRIVDEYSPDKNENNVRVVFSIGGLQIDYSYLCVTDKWNFSKSFRKDFEKYYKRSLTSDFQPELESRSWIADNTVVNRYLKNGENLGDSLQGEDDQLSAIQYEIESRGYAELDVRIESAQYDFFDQFWEAIILPDSNYILSAACRSFTRVFPEQGGAHEATNNDQQESIPNGMNVIERDALSIVYGIALGGNNQSPRVFGANYGLALHAGLTKLEGAVECALFPVFNSSGLEAAEKHLADQIDIFHLDGEVSRGENGELFWGDGNQVSLNCLFSILQNKNTQLVCLSIAGKGSEEGGSEVLSDVAKLAFDFGITNVIGLTHEADSYLGQNAYQELYGQLTSGLSIGQSVVEARKALQKNNDDVTDAAAWPLFAHYQKSETRFVVSSVDDVNPLSVGEQPKKPNHVFGFSPAGPEYHHICADDEYLKIFVSLRDESGGVVYLTGERGSGKSFFSHALAKTLTLQKHYDYAFNFEFRQSDYRKSDIFDMAAQAIIDAEGVAEKGTNETATGENLNVSDTLPEVLKTVKCLFVFQDFDLRLVAANSEFESVISELTSAGHSVLNTSPIFTEVSLPGNHIQLSPKSNIDLLRLIYSEWKGGANQGAVDTIESLSTVSAEKMKLFFDSISGNPQLAIVLGRELTGKSTAEMEEAIQSLAQQHINGSTEVYYRNALKALSPQCLSLIKLANDTPGLLWEIPSLSWAGEKVSAIGEQFVASINSDCVFDGESGTFGVSDLASSISRLSGLSLLKNSLVGHALDSNAVEYISAHLTEVNITEKTSALYSKTVCIGLASVCRHMQKQQDPHMLNYILANRRIWAFHMERLWSVQDYASFFDAKTSLEPLLYQSGLHKESYMWCKSVLNSVKGQYSLDKSGACKAWLVLASELLEKRIHADEPESDIKSMEDAAIFWQKEFEKEINTLQPDGDILHISHFLERYYAASNSWLDAISVCERILTNLDNHQSLDLEFRTLLSLSKYSTQIQLNDKALEYEGRIITLVSESDLPERVGESLLMEVAMLRLNRGDLDECESVLGILGKHSQVYINQFIENMSHDIAYARGDYVEVLAHYANIWCANEEQKQSVHTKVYIERIAHIKTNIEDGKFQRIVGEKYSELINDLEIFVGYKGASLESERVH